MENEMNSIEKDNAIAEDLKSQILSICTEKDVFVVLTALTYAMATVIVCAGDDSRDEEICQTADESLRSCLEYARKHLTKFPMREH
jgi:hypothetical protein